MYVKIQYKDTSDMNFYVWTKKKAPNLYQLGANDNEKETLIDCTSASAVFFYQIKSFVSILEDESAGPTYECVWPAGLHELEMNACKNSTLQNNIIKTAAAIKIGQKASFASFDARLYRSRFRPTRIFRSIMISAFRFPSRSMKSRSKNKLPPNAWQKRQHMLI